MATTIGISCKRSSLLDLCLHSDMIRGHVTGTIVALSPHVCNRNIIVLKELDSAISAPVILSRPMKAKKLLPNVIVLINEPGTDGEMLNVVGCHFISKNGIPPCCLQFIHNVAKHNVFPHYFNELILGLRRHVGYVTQRIAISYLIGDCKCW